MKKQFNLAEYKQLAADQSKILPLIQTRRGDTVEIKFTDFRYHGDGDYPIAGRIRSENNDRLQSWTELGQGQTDSDDIFFVYPDRYRIKTTSCDSLWFTIVDDKGNTMLNSALRRPVAEAIMKLLNDEQNAV